MERAWERLRVVVPVTLGVIFLLLYLNFRRLSDTLIVMLTLPFALVGGVWLLWALDYELSVAVGVGFIALAGVAAELGVILLVFLREAVDRYESLVSATVLTLVVIPVVWSAVRGWSLPDEADAAGPTPD